MGQFLLIQGADRPQVRRLLTLGLEQFHAVLGLVPDAQHETPTTVIATFPRFVKQSAPLARTAEPTAWACGVGTWFSPADDVEPGLDADSIPEGIALRSLIEACRRSDSPAVRIEALTAVLRDIDGAFAFVLGDDRTGGLTVVTDRVGTLHVYWAQLGNCVALSTSALVVAGLASRAFDPVAAQEFLATGSVFEDRSLFRDVKKLAPATIFRFERGALVANDRYWFVEEHLRGSPEHDTVPLLAEALEDALRRIARRFGDVVIDLTGGFDSRALVGAALRGGIPFSTVVNGPVGHPDVVAAERIQRVMGLRHRHLPLPADWQERWWTQCERALGIADGECDVLEYACVLEIHETLAATHGASVNGSGGELSKGYWWELLFPRAGRTDTLDAHRIAAARFDTDHWTRSLFRSEYEVDLTDHFAAAIERANNAIPAALNTAKLDHVYLTLRMQRWQGRIASSTDRVWSNVSPFLFKAPLEIALGTPPSAKRRMRQMRRLIEYLDPILAALPLAQGSPASPVRITNVHRFTPLALEFAKKFGRKLRGSMPAPPARGGDLDRLLRTPAVASLLDPTHMRIAWLLRPETLRALLADPTVLRPHHAGRLITLELAARAD